MQASIGNLANAAAVVALESNINNNSGTGSLIDIKLSEDIIRNVIGCHSINTVNANTSNNNNNDNSGIMIDVRNGQASIGTGNNINTGDSTSSETIDNLSSPIEFKHGDILNGDSSFLGNGMLDIFLVSQNFIFSVIFMIFSRIL